MRMFQVRQPPPKISKNKTLWKNQVGKVFLYLPPRVSSDLLFCNFHTVCEHLTDRKSPRGPFHHQSDGIQKTTQQQITWTHPPPLSWFCWWWLDDKVYSFLKVRPTHSPTMSSLHNNPPWERTTPCGHVVMGMEPHLGNMLGQWTFMVCSHEVFVPSGH